MFANSDLTRKGSVLILLIMGLIPFGSVWFQEDMAISIENSELPVKMWCYLRFLEEGRLFGGDIIEAGFPGTSALNNPDIVASLSLIHI